MTRSHGAIRVGINITMASSSVKGNSLQSLKVTILGQRSYWWGLGSNCEHHSQTLCRIILQHASSQKIDSAELHIGAPTHIMTNFARFAWQDQSVYQRRVHTWQGYPGYFWEPHWKSMVLPEISRVTWQLCVWLAPRVTSRGTCPVWAAVQQYSGHQVNTDLNMLQYSVLLIFRGHFSPNSSGNSRITHKGDICVSFVSS